MGLLVTTFLEDLVINGQKDFDLGNRENIKRALGSSRNLNDKELLYFINDLRRTAKRPGLFKSIPINWQTFWVEFNYPIITIENYTQEAKKPNPDLLKTILGELDRLDLFIGEELKRIEKDCVLIQFTEFDCRVAYDTDTVKYFEMPVSCNEGTLNTGVRCTINDKITRYTFAVDLALLPK